MMAIPASTAGSALLRVATAGSVDDGKSTLIGRLLYDTASVPEDELAALHEDAQQRGRDGLDFSLLTDGLTIEREQGITIDVAYRYFATPRRKFILADVPGHEQYTRNMVTGASAAECTLILVDARRGLTRQSRRHTYLARLLGRGALIFAINKMDLVGFREDAFRPLARQITRIARTLGATDVWIVPVAAKSGDNVVHSSANMPWYDGPPLLSLLETMAPRRDSANLGFRMPVQFVARPGRADDPDSRGYLGKVVAGAVAAGDPVLVLPSGLTSTVTGVFHHGHEAAAAVAGESVLVTLAGDLDISRGDFLAAPEAPPRGVREATVTLCWMANTPLELHRKYLVRHATRTLAARVRELHAVIDVDTLDKRPPDGPLGANEIAEAAIEFAEVLHFDPYTANRAMGSFILIDGASNATLAAGLIEPGVH